jgi:hypothetical protein
MLLKLRSPATMDYLTTVTMAARRRQKTSLPEVLI